MYVGFSASTRQNYSEVHQIQSWKFTSSGMPELPPYPTSAPTTNTSTSSTGGKVGVTVGASVGAVVALLVVGFFIAWCWRRTSRRKQDEFILVDPNLMPRMFTYNELSKSTNNFNRSELLGSGGFGAVYKGTLPSGALVAVKRMKMESKHGKESFQAEVSSLIQIRHRNLVQLRGWCHEDEQLFLVYDYIRHGSLDEWLFQFEKRNGEGPLTLSGYKALPLMLRHSIMSGVAAALCYLHEECAQCVLHWDIKASNVLLDGDWNAYLGDFGLARVIDHQKMEKTTMMAGTFGYMAPEMARTGKATKESDVYSFGILMLEVMCGSRALDSTERGEGILVDRLWRAYEAGNILEVADLTLEFEAFPPRFQPSDARNSGPHGGYETQEAASFLITDDVDPSGTPAPDAAMDYKKLTTNLLHLGLLCCNPNPGDRPCMRLVSQLLQSSEDIEMSLPPLPEHKPQRIGFSEVSAATTSWSSWSSSSGANAHKTAQGTSKSTTTAPSTTSVSSWEPSNNTGMQQSFAAPDSSVLSGR